MAGIDAASDSDAFIYQPFCGGAHYCVDAYFSLHDGHLVDVCAKQILEKSKGESFLLKSVVADGFVDMLNRVCKIIPLKGIVNFDFLDDAGTIKMLEINCRIGGNYPATHAMGCNFIEHMLNELMSGEPISGMAQSAYLPEQLVAKYFGFTPTRSLDSVNSKKL